MKLGLNGQCIKEKDLHSLPLGLKYGDTIINNINETLYYSGNKDFYLVTSNPAVYLVNNAGPWFILSSSTRVDTKTPMQKIKEWLFSIS